MKRLVSEDEFQELWSQFERYIIGQAYLVWNLQEFRVTVGIDDLVQSGKMALFQAAQRYDPTRGVKFQTFARIRINGAMLDTIRDGDYLNRYYRTKLRELRKIHAQYQAPTGQLRGRPSRARIAELLGVSDQKLSEIYRVIHSHPMIEAEYEVQKSSSSKRQSSSAAQFSLFDLIPTEAPTPEERLISRDARSIVIRAIRGLGLRERQVIYAYYFRGKTQESIAQSRRFASISSSRVSQIKAEALEHLRRRLSLDYRNQEFS